MDCDVQWDDLAVGSKPAFNSRTQRGHTTQARGGPLKGKGWGLRRNVLKPSGPTKRRKWGKRGEGPLFQRFRSGLLPLELSKSNID